MAQEATRRMDMEMDGNMYTSFSKPLHTMFRFVNQMIRSKLHFQSVYYEATPKKITSEKSRLERHRRSGSVTEG